MKKDKFKTAEQKGTERTIKILKEEYETPSEDLLHKIQVTIYQFLQGELEDYSNEEAVFMEICEWIGNYFHEKENKKTENKKLENEE